MDTYDNLIGPTSFHFGVLRDIIKLPITRSDVFCFVSDLEAKKVGPQNETSGLGLDSNGSCTNDVDVAYYHYCSHFTCKKRPSPLN